MAVVTNMIYFICLLLLRSISGAGFDVPSNLPRNLMNFHTHLSRVTSSYDNQLETPMQLRFISMNNVGIWNCMAVYDGTRLDALTNQRPAVVATDDIISNYGTEETKITCAAYAVWQTFLSYAPDSSKAAATTFYNKYGLDTSFIDMNTDVSDCETDSNEADCLSTVAANYGYTPDIMASIIAYQNIKYLSTDGWNQDGSIGTDGTACTANCRPYGDITNYVPVTNDATRWQPMVEDNGLGFFYHYDHVVPHIGQTAALKLLTRTELTTTRLSPDPAYDYDLESDLVISRLNATATSDERKMLVEFFDAKKAVTARIIGKIESMVNWDWQEKQLFIMGYTASQYDAMVAAWKEKRRWDLVRPTTVIKGYGDQDITTYAGPYQGSKTIKAKHFEAYQRVMPHSEYPSGSGCICMSGSEYALKWLTDREGNTDEFTLRFNFAAGSSGNEPGVTPANDISYSITGLEEIYKLCGETRLWGGMHYTASVQGAFDLCQGIGDMGYEYATNLENGDGTKAFGDIANYP